jgi:hypothetical protein
MTPIVIVPPRAAAVIVLGLLRANSNRRLVPNKKHRPTQVNGRFRRPVTAPASGMIPRAVKATTLIIVRIEGGFHPEIREGVPG